MRSILLFVLVTAVFGLSAASMPAQVLKSDAKEEAPKEPEYKWPEKIQGKTVDYWIKEMRFSKDASTRDEAIRTIPFFGPSSTKSLGRQLIETIKTDPDVNVRLTAIGAVPLVWFDEPFKEEGIDTLIAILKSPNQSNQTRYAVTNALGSCGPLAKKAVPTLLAVTLVDSHSWENRKAAVAALGRIGMLITKEGEKPSEAELKLHVDVIKAMARLLHLEKKDTSHLVRREAINSLLMLGPPEDAAALKMVRAALKEAYEYESHRSVGIWARVAYIRTETKLISATDPNLVHIAKVIPSSDAIIRQQKKIEAEIKASNDLESKLPLVKQNALDKMQTMVQVKTEALQAKQEALQALGSIGEEAVPKLDDLIKIAEGKDEEPFIIATALWAMSQMPSQMNKILPVIDTLSQAKEESIKTAAEAARKLLTERRKEEDKKKDAPPKK